MATPVTTRLSGTSGWKLTPAGAARAGRRGAAGESGLLAALAATGRVALDSQYIAERPARRGAADEPLTLDKVTKLEGEEVTRAIDALLSL